MYIPVKTTGTQQTPLSCTSGHTFVQCHAPALPFRRRSRARTDNRRLPALLRLHLPRRPVAIPSLLAAPPCRPSAFAHPPRPVATCGAGQRRPSRIRPPDQHADAHTTQSGQWPVPRHPRPNHHLVSVIGRQHPPLRLHERSDLTSSSVLHLSGRLGGRITQPRTTAVRKRALWPASHLRHRRSTPTPRPEGH